MFDLESAITDYINASSHTDDIKEILNSDYKYTTYINKQIYLNINIVYNSDEINIEKSDEINIYTKDWIYYLDSIINFYRNDIDKLNKNIKINIIINNKLLYNYILIFHNEHVITY